MGVMLTLICFCLIIVAFYWILMLTQRIKGLEASEAVSNALEIQDQLDEHLKAIREENARFLKEVEERIKEHNDTFVEIKRKEHELNATLMSTGVKNGPASSLSKQTTDAIPGRENESWAPPVDIEEPIDVMETSLLSRILQLQEDGLSTEKIAKQLSLGKGEVALMLKLHEKR